MRESQQTGALTEATLLILISLYTVKHGYSIGQYVEELTAGRVKLGVGTLYGAISSLEDKGWIEVVATEGRRKDYHITAAGREQVAGEAIRLKEMLRLIEQESQYD